MMKLEFSIPHTDVTLFVLMLIFMVQVLILMKIKKDGHHLLFWMCFVVTLSGWVYKITEWILR